ncbi:MAG TPA: VWA domain-containing protein [bacterium]|nr:VWA domain-containing protein [bacterium]
MRFGMPSCFYALLLIPPLIAFLIWGWRQRERALKRFVSAGLDKRLAADLSVTRRRWKNVLLIFAVSLSLVSLTRPQWGFRWEEVRRRGVDIMIAVDVSKSMLAGDVSPSRLERAKRKVEDFLNLLQGDRVGLIAFSGRAFVMTPLTLDYGAIRLFLDPLSPDLITAQGTNVGEAIDLGLKSLKQGNPDSQSLLLMSDGEDLSGDALDAAKKAAEQGVRIYALGVGTEGGAPIPAEGGGFKKDASGQIVLTRLDESILEKMASQTGGVYARSVADDRDLEAIYAGMRGKLEEKELKAGRQKHFIERYAWFLLPALLLLIAESLMSETKNGGLLKRRLALMILISALFSPLFGPKSAAAFNLPGTIQEGERLYRAGKYDDALQKFLSAQIDHPQDTRLQYNLGNTYYQLKRYEDARKLFDAAAKSASKDARLQERSLYNRGNAQFRSDKLEDAVSSYEEALKIDPKDEDARYNLELARRRLEQKKEQQQEQPKQPKSNQGQDQKNDQGRQQSAQDQKQGKSQEQQPKESQDQQQTAEPQDQQKKGGEKESQVPQKTQGNQEQEDHPGQGEQPVAGKMTRDEAERWLSTLHEDRGRIIPKGRQNGKGKSGKDW